MAENRKTTCGNSPSTSPNSLTSKQFFELNINGRTIRSAEAVQAAILEAAIEEFSANGFSGARVDTIALRAKTNKRMLYHYFTDKAGLYIAVLERVFEDAMHAEQSLNLKSIEPVEAIRKLALFVWHYFLEHPQVVKIISAENQLNARYLEQSKKIPLIHSHFSQELSDVLHRGAQSGIFRSDINPAHIHLTILSMSFYCINNQHTISLHFKRNFLSPETIEIWGEQIVKTILATIMYQASASQAQA